MKHYQDFLDEGVSALLPVYANGVGDSTLLITLKGERKMIHKKLKTVLKALSSSFSYDLVDLRKNYGNIIGQKHKIPIPLHPDLILIPFKIRQPMIKGDNTYGYINYRCIIRAEKDNNYCRLILNNGIEIPLMQSLSTTQKNILNAKVVTNQFLEKHYKNVKKLDELQKLTDELHHPATRGDIIVLYQHITRLLEILESISKPH